MDNSIKNKYSVIYYSGSCCSKLMMLFLSSVYKCRYF